MALLENIIILFKSKLKQCMLAKDTKSIPVEDIAISSLLEIDLKQQQDLNIWEQKTSQKANNKRRTSAFHRTQQSKVIHISKPHNQALNDMKSSRSNLDKQLMRLSSEDFELQDSEKSKLNQKMSRSSQFNEGEYWSSKINWMEINNKKQRSSQPKLNKKLSFSHESNSRKSQRQYFRYENEEKSRQKYLLTHKDVSKYKQQLSSKNLKQSTQIQSNNSKNKSSLRKLSSKYKNQQNDSKLTNQVQQYMRQTLKRIYHKNRKSESLANPKPPQYERSSMIRQLLINLENVKDFQNSSIFQNVNTNAKENKNELNQLAIESNNMDQLIATSKFPQRKFYHRLNQKHVLNLNEQAEKQYKNKSNNFWNTKKQILIKV